MNKIAFASIAALLALPGAAQPDWRQARLVPVRLASFDYDPEVIRLAAGQPVVLRLSNVSGSGHDFTARSFFAAAALRPQDRALVVDGSVEVPPRQSRDVALVPAPGRYKVKCTHTFHKMLGMSGEIWVS